MFLCMLANRLPMNVHLIVASRDRFLLASEAFRLGAKVYQIGTEQLRLNHTGLTVYAHRCGTDLSEAQVESLLYSSEGWFSAVYLNLLTLSEYGVLPGRTSDIYTTFTAAMIDPLPEKQREFLAVMGLADEFTVEMAQFITGDTQAKQMIFMLTEQNAFVKRLPDGITYRFRIRRNAKKVYRKPRLRRWQQMLKAYKYRIYPNNEQKTQIAKTFGCCRFTYNQTLAYRKFFKEHAGYPKFKSKHDNHKSYTTNRAVLTKSLTFS